MRGPGNRKIHFINNIIFKEYIKNIKNEPVKSKERDSITISKPKSKLEEKQLQKNLKANEFVYEMLGEVFIFLFQYF